MSASLTSNFFLNARGLTFADGNGFTWSFNTNTNSLSVAGTALSSVSVRDSITGGGTPASPLQLSGDSTTPGNSRYYGTNGSGTRGWYASATIPVGANPIATIGLTAVNGSSANFMDADSAPALSQAIAPTWTNAHIFSGNVVTIKNSVALALDSNAAATQLYTSWAINGTIQAYIGVAGASGNLIGGSGANDLCVRSNGNTIRWSTNSGASTSMALAGGALTLAGGLGINGNAAAAQSTGWGTPTGGAVSNNFSGGAATLATLGPAVAQIIAVLKAAGLLGT